MKLLEDRCRKKNGVTLFCVGIPERPREKDARLQGLSMVRESGLSCPYAYGALADGSIPVSAEYGVRGTSWFIVIGPDGRVAFNYYHPPGKTAEERAENLAAMIGRLSVKNPEEK